jgi:hypothetical protein
MQDEVQSTPETRRSDYEPPQVERVMDANELAREVHYAGFTQIS